MPWPRRTGSKSKLNLRAQVGVGCNYHDNEVKTSVNVEMVFGFTLCLLAADIVFHRTRACTHMLQTGRVVFMLSINTSGHVQRG